MSVSLCYLFFCFFSFGVLAVGYQKSAIRNQLSVIGNRLSAIGLPVFLSLFILYIFAHDAEIVGMLKYATDSCVVIRLVFPFHIHIEVVFVALAEYGHGLYFAEVDVLLSETLKYRG